MARHWMSGLAAAVALAGLIVLGLPSRGSAGALVEQSIQASKSAGDRHYEIGVVPPRPPGEERSPVSLGTLDVRDPEHFVLTATSPEGDTIALGHDDMGAWAVHPDGGIERFPPRGLVPPWVNFGTSTVMLVSVDDLLHTLRERYELKKGEEAPLPGGSERMRRITAVRERRPEQGGQGGPPPGGAGPQRVKLWIDPSSHVVRRMELHWPARMRPGPGPGMRPRPDGERQDGEEGVEDRPPPPPPPPDEPLPGGREMPRDRFGEGGPPPLPPPRDRPPPPGARGPHHGPRPEFMEGPPDFARHPPPPRMVVFELKEAPARGAEWFGPGAHTAR